MTSCDVSVMLIWSSNWDNDISNSPRAQCNQSLSGLNILITVPVCSLSPSHRVRQTWDDEELCLCRKTGQGHWMFNQRAVNARLSLCSRSVCVIKDKITVKAATSHNFCLTRLQGNELHVASGEFCWARGASARLTWRCDMRTCENTSNPWLHFHILVRLWTPALGHREVTFEARRSHLSIKQMSFSGAHLSSWSVSSSTLPRV